MPASRQSAAVLLQLLAERSSALGRHTSDLAALADATPSPPGRRRAGPGRASIPSMDAWPRSEEQLVRLQERLACLTPPPWSPTGEAPAIAGCFVAFPRGEHGAGAAGDRAVAAAALLRAGRVLARATLEGAAGAPYRAGLLALREGQLLEAAVRALGAPADVLLVDGTGRDHPRGAGLALHLGWALGVATVGVTHRALLADGSWPPARRGARSPLLLRGSLVGAWLRTREGARPLAVHAGWRTDAATAAELVLACTRVRTPEPLREARRLARTARARATRC